MTEAIDLRPAITPEFVELLERPAAVVTIEGRVDEFPRLLGDAFGVTAQAIGASGAVVAGHPFVRYHGFGERIQAEAGFPFAGTLRPTERVHQIVLPGGRAVRAVHVGSYDQIGAAWERVNAWLGEHELVGNGAPWEAYLTGPDEPGPPITEILFPVR